jgi:hypothetical protein
MNSSTQSSATGGIITSSMKTCRRPWADLTIAVVLAVMGLLLALSGCEAQRACDCVGCDCPRRQCAAPCSHERPVEVQSPDVEPLPSAKPPNADQLIGGPANEK